jgi:hypothetical protein
MSLPKKRKTLDERIEEANAALTRESQKLRAKEKTMSATNRKQSNKPERDKLAKTQKREKIVAQKTGKKDKTGKPRKKVETGLRPVSTTTKDATVTIKPRAVKIKPAA